MKVNYATCPHCHRTMSVNTISRYHGDRCKLAVLPMTEEQKLKLKQIEKEISKVWNSDHFQRVINDHKYAESLVEDDPVMKYWCHETFLNLPKLLKPDRIYKEYYKKYYQNKKNK